MATVKLGIIGAGGMAKQHLEVIRAIEGIEVVAITSRTRSKAEALAGEYKIPAVFDDAKSLVKSAQPDALMVLVSCEQMYSVACEALQYRVPLFLEKPAGMVPEENKKLAELARECGIRSMVGFNRRYYSIFHKGIGIIKQHGPLFGVHVEGHERMWLKNESSLASNVRANWIFANSIHTIDLLRFFGGDIKSIHSIAQRRLGEARGDQFAAIAEFDSGAIGQYSAHWYSPGGWRAVLYGDGVTVEFEPLEKGTWMGKDFVSHEIEPDEVDIKYKPGLYRQMEAFGKLVRGEASEWPALDLEGSYNTMQLAQQIAAPKI